MVTIRYSIDRCCEEISIYSCPESTVTPIETSDPKMPPYPYARRNSWLQLPTHIIVDERYFLNYHSSHSSFRGIIIIYIYFFLSVHWSLKLHVIIFFLFYFSLVGPFLQCLTYPPGQVIHGSIGSPHWDTKIKVALACIWFCGSTTGIVSGLRVAPKRNNRHANRSGSPRRAGCPPQDT